METTTNTPEIPPFERLVRLMSIYSTASHLLGEIEADINKVTLSLTVDKLADYAALQMQMEEAAAQMEALAKANPEWFGEKRSIATPYGTVKFHQSSSLEVVDEAATIMLLEQKAQEVVDDGDGEIFDLDQYIKTSQKLNLEALEKLPDSELAELGVTRKHADNFSVVASKVGMAKAVKAAKKQQEEAAKESEVTA